MRLTSGHFLANQNEVALGKEWAISEAQFGAEFPRIHRGRSQQCLRMGAVHFSFTAYVD